MRHLQSYIKVVTGKALAATLLSTAFVSLAVFASLIWAQSQGGKSLQATQTRSTSGYDLIVDANDTTGTCLASLEAAWLAAQDGDRIGVVPATYDGFANWNFSGLPGKSVTFVAMTEPGEFPPTITGELGLLDNSGLVTFEGFLIETEALDPVNGSLLYSVYVDGASMRFVNCLFDTRPAGWVSIEVWYGGLELIHCTLLADTEWYGGVNVANGATLDVVNSILWNSSGTSILVTGNNMPNIENSIVSGIYDYWAECSGSSSTTQNEELEEWMMESPLRSLLAEEGLLAAAAGGGVNKTSAMGREGLLRGDAGVDAALIEEILADRAELSVSRLLMAGGRGGEVPLSSLASSGATVWDVDPLLTDDGYLTENSPARNAGLLDFAEVDIFGQARPFGPLPDIGCHEFTVYEDPEDPEEESELPEWWMLKYFGHTNVNPNGYDAANGMTYLQVYLEGRTPHAGSVPDTSYLINLKVYTQLK